MNRFLLTCLLLLFSLCIFGQQRIETSIITFGLDEDQLSASAKTLLTGVALEASTTDIYRVELFGHTDQQGDEGYNADLAKRRATTVAQALVELGLEEDKILVKSFGESKLLETEESETAFAKNRRVELVLHTESIQSEKRLFELLAASRTFVDVIDHDKENQLIGNEGVKLLIPANAFVYADGRSLPAGARIEVVLEEATRPSSMMAHRLSTNGATGRLSTGGMVKVSGIYQGETLHLASGKAIDVEIPTQEFDTEMRLYLGERRADTGMNWGLDDGESITKSTRIAEGNAKKKRILDADEIEMVEEIKASLAKRNHFLALMKTERLEHYSSPSFPQFRALPKAFDPKAGIPKRPFIPEPPTRKIAVRSGIFSLKGESQRKLDEAYLTDSIAYAQELPNYTKKLASYADQLVQFEAETPERAEAHQAKIDEIIDFRVEQAQAYLTEEYSHAAAQTVLNWKEKLETTGPYARKSLKKLRLDNLVGASGHADADVVIGKALGPQMLSERFNLDTIGFSFEIFERNFLEEKGLTAPMDSVKQIQRHIDVLFSDLKNKRNRAANKQGDQFNKLLTSSYSFQIRTPVPTWHNCDHELPEGLYQIFVSKPGSAPTYLYSQDEKTLDYFPAGSSASAVYSSPVSLAILSFGIVEDNLKLAVGSTKASRSQTTKFGLKYTDATLDEIESALVALDGV